MPRSPYDSWRVPPRDPPDPTVTTRQLTPDERIYYGLDKAPTSPKEELRMPSPITVPAKPEASHPLADLLAQLHAEKMRLRTQRKDLKRALRALKHAESDWQDAWRSVRTTCRLMGWPIPPEPRDSSAWDAAWVAAEAGDDRLLKQVSGLDRWQPEAQEGTRDA